LFIILREIVASKSKNKYVFMYVYK